MDKREARSILSAYRADEMLADDARFDEALTQAEADPALAEWWQSEQKLDRLIGSKLEQVNVPADLQARILGKATPVARSTWPRKIAMLAASIVLLAVFFGSWQGLFQPATSLADYRGEMVSFIRLDPSLDLKTSQLSRVTTFLKESGAPSDLKIPERLRQLDPVGCRTLRFRGEEVGLICFRSEGGELVHLLVVDRKAMSKFSRDRSTPQFAAEGEWMTAAWREGDQIYLLTAKGGHEAAAKYFGTS